MIKLLRTGKGNHVTRIPVYRAERNRYEQVFLDPSKNEFSVDAATAYALFTENEAKGAFELAPDSQARLKKLDMNPEKFTTSPGMLFEFVRTIEEEDAEKAAKAEEKRASKVEKSGDSKE